MLRLVSQTIRRYITTDARTSVNWLMNVKNERADDQAENLIGWVRKMRSMKNVSFLDISDGSCAETLQLVIPSNALPKVVSLGTCVRVTGVLRSNPRSANVELVVKELNVVGSCDSVNNPLDHLSSCESERQWPHLRPKQASFSSILRLRHNLEHAMRCVYDKMGYFNIHTPLMTRMDCEGGGETFRINGGNAFFDPKPSVVECEGIHLTVSSQLHLEAAMCGLGRVFTISPAWRAEKSLTRHHLAEFYMVEAESIDACHVNGLCEEAETFLRHVASAFVDRLSVSDTDGVELKFDLPKSGIVQRIKNFASTSFERITFAEGLEILLQHADHFSDAVPSPSTIDFSKEQEFFLTRHFGDRPVFVTDFPGDAKPMYCAHNENGTAKAIDLLLPGVGEVLGGSVRENDVDVLRQRMTAVSQDLPSSLDWYLDLRRFGSPPHGGYGIGFDRLLLFFLGIQNIKDVVPFPRFYQSCRL